MDQEIEQRLSGYVSLDKVCMYVFGFSSRRYRHYAMEGRLPTPIKGKIDLIQAFRMFRILKDEQILASSKGVSLTEQRARLTKINADRRELMLLEEKERLLDTDKVIAYTGHIAMKIRAKILAMPTKLSPMLTNRKKVQEIKDIMEKYAYETLEELADPKTYFLKSGKRKYGRDRSKKKR